MPDDIRPCPVEVSGQIIISPTQPTGAVQLKVNQKNMKSIPFVKATDVVNGEFRKLIEPLYRDMRNRFDECEALGRTRDILLPKLLSGELATVG